MTKPLIATAALFAGLVAGQVIGAQATEPEIITETIIQTETEYLTVPQVIPIEVTVPFDHELHAETLGYMSASERICNHMIHDFTQMAHDLGTPMICLSTGEHSLIESDYAGFYNGNVVIFTNEYTDPSYYAEVAAHELGHAFDATQLTDTERDEVVAIMGWDAFDIEHYADVAALSLGYWADYGNGWRHQGEAPTVDQLDALHAAELLPTMN